MEEKEERAGVKRAVKTPAVSAPGWAGGALRLGHQAAAHTPATEAPSLSDAVTGCDKSVGFCLHYPKLNDAEYEFHPWLPEQEHMNFTVNTPKPHTLTIQMDLKVPQTDLPEHSCVLCVHGFLPLVPLSQWFMGILAAGVIVFFFFHNARRRVPMEVRQTWADTRSILWPSGLPCAWNVTFLFGLYLSSWIAADLITADCVYTHTHTHTHTNPSPLCSTNSRCESFVRSQCHQSQLQDWY